MHPQAAASPAGGLVRGQFKSPCGAGFSGSPGYVASWRPLYQSPGAIKIIGSRFKTFAEAKDGCNTMLAYLKSKD